MSQMMIFWYRKIADFTRIIDKMNHSANPMVALFNEGIRRIVKEAEGYLSGVTETDEMPAVTDSMNAEWQQAREHTQS